MSLKIFGKKILNGYLDIDSNVQGSLIYAENTKDRLSMENSKLNVNNIDIKNNNVGIVIKTVLALLWVVNSIITIMT